MRKCHMWATHGERVCVKTCEDLCRRVKTCLCLLLVHGCLVGDPNLLEMELGVEALRDSILVLVEELLIREGSRLLLQKREKTLRSRLQLREMGASGGELEG